MVTDLKKFEYNSFTSGEKLGNFPHLNISENSWCTKIPVAAHLKLTPCIHRVNTNVFHYYIKFCKLLKVVKSYGVSYVKEVFVLIFLSATLCISLARWR